jgi:hypothetical protein
VNSVTGGLAAANYGWGVNSMVGSRPVKTVALIARQTDAFCARLNAGLTAVALVLAIVTAAALVQRLPMLLLPQVDAETGISTDQF